MKVSIRQLAKTDCTEVEKLTRESFWNLYRPGCDEHFLVRKIINHEDYVEDLSFVAELEGKIIGAILSTKSSVKNAKNENLETISFGPFCVHPNFQRTGVGTQLIQKFKRVATEQSVPAVIILGDPHNYCKHGFKNGKDFGVSDTEGRFPLGLLVLELLSGAFGDDKWIFKESDVYQIDPIEFEKFEQSFLPKEKKYCYSQDLFHILIRSYLID